MRKLKLISKKELNEDINVYDIEVKDEHNYILKNGILSHNSIGSYIGGNEVSGGGGVKYNASIIFELSKKKMKEDDDKENEKLAKKSNVENTKIGVTIKMKPIKSRFARPIKVETHIPFYKKPNPYVGLHQFINWDVCGIIRGKSLTEKEYSKLSDSDKKNCKPFEVVNEVSSKVKDPSTNKTVVKKVKNKTTMYAFPKDTARTIVVRHLGGEIPISELFTSKVFTNEVLKELDEKVIQKAFKLPDQSEEYLEDITEEIDN